MYNKILVPLDGSKRAERILPHVESMAHKFTAELLLLQVVNPNIAMVANDEAAYYPIEEIEQVSTDAKAYLDGLQREFLAKGIHAKTKVAHGPIVTTIIEVADNEKVDLIALASHGRTGLARVFYGSVAVGLLHRTDRPVYIIRAQ